MTIIDASSDPRLDTLLATRATQQLTTREQAELHQLLATHDDIDADHYAEAATLIALAAPTDAAPPALRERLQTRAIGWLADRCGLRLRRPPLALAILTPWLVAAACLAAAFVGWLADDAPTVTPALGYEQMAAAPGTVVLSWSDVDGGGAGGTIAWDPVAGEGVMKLVGLEVNDPTVQQYQLWVFDAGRKSFTEFDAVDGGVFDVQRGGGATYVRFRPTLPVSDPYLFAVTTEPAGGVVKHVDHGDSRIVLAAPLDV